MYEIKLKGIIDEDFVNYKVPTMTLMFPKCKGFKCNDTNQKKVCQNMRLAKKNDIEIGVYELCKRYLNNKITKAICFSGLEPMDDFHSLMLFIVALRQYHKCKDDIIIYTGYNKDEIKEQIKKLSLYDNIIVKFGRYLEGYDPHYDPVLGVKLASDNQYGEKLK